MRIFQVRNFNFYVKKTDWDKYTELLSLGNTTPLQINSKPDLDIAVNDLTSNIQQALHNSTKSITVTAKPKVIMTYQTNC